MIKNIFLVFKQIFSPKSFKIQTFTYYIPSPPPRDSGYREKGFDKVFYSFINQGFEIISITTQANKGPNHSGMWIIATVRSTNKKAARLNLGPYSSDLDMPREMENGPVSIDGFYTLDDKNVP